ncbi:hypothetical protein [Nocardia asteroides]|uniref:hypothetical protein n=1 Tax=Nocardia asteroides TaxID=1824 RepID=UPI0034048F63
MAGTHHGRPHSKGHGKFRRRGHGGEKAAQRVAQWTHCEPCGKRRYQSKAAAKQQARTHTGNYGSMSAYECPAVPGQWHIGHLPRAVVRGEIDRTTYYSLEG